jgi:hypothetical protein
VNQAITAEMSHKNDSSRFSDTKVEVSPSSDRCALPETENFFPALHSSGNIFLVQEMTYNQTLKYADIGIKVFDFSLSSFQCYRRPYRTFQRKITLSIKNMMFKK